MGNRLMLALLLGLAGCSSPTVEPDLTERPQPAAFDLALVKMHFTNACTNPTFDVEYACQQMDIAGMTADGSTLVVPTELDPSARRDGRGDEVCHLPATVHYDRRGDDLGFDTITILGAHGDIIATCSAVAP
jgi:putative hemolysin